MNKLLKTGRIIFAGGILGLGILCIVFKDFVVGRPPAWPAAVDVGAPLGYFSALLLISSAILVVVKKYAVQASLLVAALILLLSVSRHLFHFAETWPNAWKSIALFGGCLIIAHACSKQDGIALPGYMRGNILVTTGTVLLGLFLMVCGYAHFKYPAFVDTLIPAYIPFHTFWTYFCGICLLAGGVGVAVPLTRRLAALLSGIMIGGWFILLHIPRFFANVNDASDRLGLCESFTFCGIFLVLAAVTAKKR